MLFTGEIYRARVFCDKLLKIANEARASLIMLPEDYILRFVQTTIDVVTPPISQERPELLSDWRTSVESMFNTAQKEQLGDDMDFFKALLNILSEKPHGLPDNHSYQPYLADVKERIYQQTVEYGRLLIQQQRQAYQQLAEMTLAVMTDQPEQKAEVLELLQELYKNLVGTGSYSVDEATYYRLLENIIQETPMKIHSNHPYAALQDQILNQIEAYHAQDTD